MLTSLTSSWARWQFPTRASLPEGLESRARGGQGVGRQRPSLPCFRAGTLASIGPARAMPVCPDSHLLGQDRPRRGPRIRTDHSGDHTFISLPLLSLFLFCHSRKPLLRCELFQVQDLDRPRLQKVPDLWQRVRHTHSPSPATPFPGCMAYTIPGLPTITLCLPREFPSSAHPKSPIN